MNVYDSKLCYEIYKNCKYKDSNCKSKDFCLMCDRRWKMKQAEFERSSKFKYYLDKIKWMLLEEEK